MSFMQLHCPFCEHAHEDPFEVLDSDVLDSMKCEECAKTFWYAIMECHRCAHEQTFTWPHEPASESLDQLTCESCGSTFRVNDGQAEQEADFLSR